MMMALQLNAAELYLKLNDCIDMALEKNSDIILSKEDKKIAQSKTTNAWSTILPKIGFASGYNKGLSRQASLSLAKNYNEGKIPTSAASMLEGFGFGEEQESYSMKLTFQQLLFGMHAIPTLKAAEYGIDLAEYNCIAQKLNIILKTKEAYYNILKSDELFESALENHKLTKKLIEKTEEMVNVGLATSTDLLRLKLQLKNIEQGALLAQSNTKTARAQLNLILGESVNTGITLEPISKVLDPAYKKLNLERLTKEAINKRPELKILDYQIKLYKTQIAVIESANYPNIFFNGSLGMMNYEPNLKYDRDKDWMVAVTGQWNVFDGGDIASRAEEIRSIIRKIKEQKEAFIRSIEFELSLIINEITLAISKSESALAEVAFARQNNSLINEKYLSNAATNLEVVDSQTSLISAMINLINAQYDFEIAKARLEKIRSIENQGVNNE
jgi:outer membrane protein